MNTWDLTTLFKDEEQFNKELEDVSKNLVPQISTFKGKLGDEKELGNYFKLERELTLRISKLGNYASMKSDLDKRDMKNASALAKVDKLYNDVNEADSFSSPELIGLGKEYFAKFFEKNPEFKDFDYIIEKMFLNQAHVLSSDKEELLSYFGPIYGKGGDLYSALSVADNKPREATLKNGEKVKVTQGNWLNLIAHSEEAEDRKTIFETLYSYYDEHKTIYGEIYNDVVQTQLANMKARGYKSILEMHLAGNKIPTDVFFTLVKVAKEKSAPLKKYIKLREKYLPLEKYHTYERTMQFTSSSKKYSYQEAKEFFFDSIKKFPSDFQNKAHEVLKEGYVDVYEHEGKRSGAYSTNSIGLHPFILLNFQGTLDDCFTLAHESGHSIHTLYANEYQEPMKADYTIFVAEIASTFNEHNLLDYMVNRDDIDLDQKIMLLQKSIDEICSTFYRQTVFGDYEYQIATKGEQGEPINYEVCNNVIVDLYKQYYGMDITEEKYKCYAWAYIPHLFYTPFYVYQYSTSFTASMEFYKRVKEGGEKEFEKYLSLLKMGGSDFPVDEVKKAGVDLTAEETYESVTNRMEELVDELEVLLKEKFGK